MNKMEGHIRIKEKVLKLKPELIKLRRDFHMYPELGREEFRTAQTIESYLNSLGVETQRLANTGVVGLLSGDRPGKTLLLRADMDALPVEEMTGVEYQSCHKGKMHACGHDGHVAMLLVAANILSGLKKEICGTIKFVFQPDEEGADSGAAMLIEQGVLNQPDVDAAMGLHLMTSLRTGCIGISQGCVMADTVVFNLLIKGKGGHTAMPHQSIDPLMVAANLITIVQGVQTRQIDVLKPTSVVFGKIQAGSGANIIPEHARLQGTIRCLYDSKGEESPSQKFENTVHRICQIYGAGYDIEFTPAAAPVVNDPLLYRMVKAAAETTVNRKENVTGHTTMIAEDFGYFGTHIPSCFYFIGAASPDLKNEYPHHHPKFSIDENALEIGVEMHVKSALAYLDN